MTDVNAGPYISFAGAAWTDRPNAQALSVTIPCHFHFHDDKAKVTLARHLGALKRALLSLEKYYKALQSGLPTSPRNPLVPYPSSFSLVDSSKQYFDYAARKVGNNNLIFSGQLQNGGGDIFIKFTRRYCKEAHEFCVSKNIAPKLYAVESLPGGWYMVVMEDVRSEYEDLYDFIQHPDHKGEVSSRNYFVSQIRKSLEELHEAGFVHGDIRNTNIMVKRSGLDGSFYLVDFDWSGRIDEVRYPIGINVTTVKRPDGVVSGELIIAQHDIASLDYIQTF